MKSIGKWIELETIILSKGTQNQEVKCPVLSHQCILQKITQVICLSVTGNTVSKQDS